MLQVRDGVADVDGLVKKLQHHHARREHLLHLREHLADFVHDLDGIGPRSFLHGQGHGRLAVHPDDIGLVLVIVPHFPDIPDVYRPLADVGNDDIFDGLHQAELGFGKEAVVVRPGLDIPRGKNQVGLLDGLDDGVGGQVESLQALPVEVHVDLPNFPSGHPGGGDVRHMLDLRLDDVIGQVIKLAFVEPPAHQGDENDRNLGDVKFPDDRILYFLGQIAVDQVDRLQNIRLGAVQVGPPVEVNRHQGGPLPGNGGDVFHPVHRGDRFFHRIGDHPFHVLRVRARVKGGHGDGGEGDVREHVHGQLGERR